MCIRDSENIVRQLFSLGGNAPSLSLRDPGSAKSASCRSTAPAPLDTMPRRGVGRLFFVRHGQGPSSCLQETPERGPHVCWSRSHFHPSRFQCSNLFLGCAHATGNDCARVAHTFAGRGHSAGYEPGYGLSNILANEIRGAFLSGAPNFTDQQDRVCIRIAIEQVEHLHEVKPTNRIAADPYTGRLTHPQFSELSYGFIRQSA